MDIKKSALQSILKAIDELNDILPQGKKLEKSNETLLHGNNTNLDSLGFVNLITAIEKHIEDNFDVSITLADDRAMSQKRSPFLTVETLVDYIAILLGEKNNE